MLAHLPLAAALLSTNLPTILGAPGASSADAPKTLGDAFDVWTGKEEDSCLKYYDNAVALGKGGGKVLNDQWDQIIDMNAAALESLTADKYDESLTIRNHVKNFFGMAPWKTEAGTEMAPPAAGKKKVRVTSPENARSREMYEHIKLWFNNVDGYIKRKAGKNWTANAKKPILACGSNFMHPVTPDDYDRDKTGKPTKKKFQDVPELAQLFEKNYVFWLDEPFNRHWYAPKETMSNPQQWPKDSSGKKHYCNAPESTGLTLLSKQQPVFKAIVVCPQVLDKSNDKDKRLSKPVITAQSKNTLLDDMGVKALHLYKQMFKLFHGEVFVEEIQEDPRDRPVYVAATQMGWPGKAEAWKPAGTAEQPVFVSTGIDALWLTLHDRAEDCQTSDEEQSIEGLDALNSPGNFVWYALVNFMSSKTGQDWCTGRPRPAKSPWMLVWSKSKNSPGPLFDEARLKQMSKNHLNRQGILWPDSSDSDGEGEIGAPGRSNTDPIPPGAAADESASEGPVASPGGPPRSNTAPGAIDPSNKGKKPEVQSTDPKKQQKKEKPKPVVVANPPKAPGALMPPKPGGAGTKVTTGGASGQVIKQQGAAGQLAGAQGKQTGQANSLSTSSGSELESA